MIAEIGVPIIAPNGPASLFSSTILSAYCSNQFLDFFFPLTVTSSNNIGECIPSLVITSPLL